MEWLAPESLYVADVHGSVAHRDAIQEALRHSQCQRWAFRWLHEPLAEFAGQRGDAHAGGVETALVNHVNSDLVDSRWWPDGIEHLAAGQMPMSDAIELSTNLPQFIARVESRRLNGIVGDIRNAVDPRELMRRMLHVARQDVEGLVARGARC